MVLLKPIVIDAFNKRGEYIKSLALNIQTNEFNILVFSKVCFDYP